MIDRFVLVVPLDCSEFERVAVRNRLTQYTRNGELFYTSGKECRLSSLYIALQGNKATIKGSLHKLYNNLKTGRADNSGRFTMEQAQEAFILLEDITAIAFEKAKITYYEIGYNIQVERNPSDYIRKARSIGEANEPLLYEEARVNEGKQKSTRRTKAKKKYYKIYDKQQETKEKQRRDIPPTLRIETAYKRQSKSLEEFVKPSNLYRLKRAFVKDWGSLEFRREYQGRAGVHQSQATRIAEISELGKDEYLQRERERLDAGTISPKQYRTIREFVRDFDKHKDKAKAIISKEEKEYQIAIYQLIKE